MSRGLPTTALEFATRHRAYGQGRTVVAVLGWVPLLVLYVFSHTKYLRPYVPDSKGLAVVVLIVIPMTWLLGIAWAYRRVRPAAHGLVCPGCHARLVDDAYKSAAATGRCARCDAAVLIDAEAPAGAPAGAPGAG